VQSSSKLGISKRLTLDCNGKYKPGSSNLHSPETAHVVFQPTSRVDFWQRWTVQESHAVRFVVASAGWTVYSCVQDLIKGEDCRYQKTPRDIIFPDLPCRISAKAK
jgi:hypothetical protein